MKFKPSVTAVTLFVRDLPKSREFSKLLTDGEPIFEDEVSAAFQTGNVVINLLAPPAVPELISPCKAAAENSGSKAVYTTFVPRVDEAAEELNKHGISIFSGLIDRPWGIRIVNIQDYDGNIWELANKL